MRRLVGLVLVGSLVGAIAHEGLRPLGELSSGPQITQETSPPPRHPYDPLFDIRDVREPILREATRTTAQTVPGPAGEDSAFAPVAQLPDNRPALLFTLAVAFVLFSTLSFSNSVVPMGLMLKRGSLNESELPTS